MTPYIILLLIPIWGSVSSNSLNFNNKAKKSFVYVFFVALYFLFILRDVSVGRDLQGYLDAYEQADNYDWFDHSWIYMESGYVFLMKLFSHIGISFRGFLMFCYLLIVIPLASYIYQYSKDVPLSIIIYICFQFFVFNMSGLRQSMAMSCCLMAFMNAQKTGKINLIKFIFLVICASLIHRSALIFLPAYFVMRIGLNFRWCALYLVLGVAVSIAAPLFLMFLHENEITDYEFDESMTNGSSFIMYIVLLLLSVILSRKDNRTVIRFNRGKSSKINLSIANYANMLAVSVLLLLSFSGTALMRSAIYYNIVFIILVPELISRLDKSIQPIAKFCFIALMVFIFLYSVLLPSQFDIVPYKLAEF